MTNYMEYGVKLTDGQKTNLARAIKTNSELSLRLKNNQLSGRNELMLTKTQVNKIKKAAQNKTGVVLKISKSHIRKSVKQGGSLFSSLALLGAKALPFVTKAASKAFPALATGAVSALGSLGIDKMFGKGQSGGFLIPQNKIDELIQYKDWLIVPVIDKFQEKTLEAKEIKCSLQLKRIQMAVDKCTGISQNLQLLYVSCEIHPPVASKWYIIQWTLNE